MKIIVTENGKQLVNLPLPTALIFSRSGWRTVGKLTQKAVKKSGEALDGELEALTGLSDTLPDSAAFRQLRRDLAHFRKIHPDLPLVEVEDSDGTYVLITL